MTKIYQLNLRENVDVFSVSNLPQLIGEEWFFFDSSVFVGLTNSLIDGKAVLEGDFLALARLLSTRNINIHPLAILEAAKDSSGNKTYCEERGIKHLHSMLLAQALDFWGEKTDHPFQISEAKSSYILNQYSNYKASSLVELATLMFNDLFLKNPPERCQQSIQISEPFLTAAREANLIKGTVFQKLQFFFDNIPPKPRLPKILDYCVRMIVLSNREPLLGGALKKVKRELQNSAWDIALFELSQLGNFSEPFEDLRPLGTLFTCDTNMYYYAKLGRPLVISIPGFTGRIYYPDLSFLKEDKKALDLVREKFQINTPMDLREILIQKVAEKKTDLSQEDFAKAVMSIVSTDFSKYSIYKYQREAAA